MKRSKSITLLMAGASVAMLALAACDNSGPTMPDSSMYQTVQECKADLLDDGRRRFTDTTCEMQFANAQEEHEKKAPRFNTQAECEAVYTKCQPPTAGGSHNSFMPFMMGYMMGNMTGSRPAPVYHNYSGGTSVLSSGGGTRPVTVAPSGGGASVGTTARGGFGATAGAHGGGGS